MSVELEIRLRPFTGATGLMASARRLSQLKSAANFPETAKAVARATREAQREMLRATGGKFVTWSGGTFRIRRITGRLQGSILGGYRYPLQGNPLKGGIEIKMRHWQFVKNGIAPYDMKPGLLASKNARYSRKGIKYVVVPLPMDPEKVFGARIFRIVTSRSRGWIHPGTLPRRADLYAAERTKEAAIRSLKAAMRADLGIQ